MAMEVLSPASAIGSSIVPSTTSSFLPMEQFFLSGKIIPRWEIIQPLLLTAERDEDGSYLISDDFFGVYGDGSSISEALTDYMISLGDYYEILSVKATEDDNLVKEQFYRLQRYLRIVDPTSLWHAPMPRRPRDIETALQTKFGFVRAAAHSSDHHGYELRLPGLPLILTKVSHSKQDIGPKLEGKIARQLRVRKPYFDGMIEC
jgi:predicted RNase H-like HicB family nuclease